MHVIKDRYGTYYVQKRVPEHLQEAVAHVLDADEPRRVFLKKSLGTKSLKEAKAAAPHVMADFNRIIGEAEAHLKEQALVTTLTDTLIKRMADSYYATMLADDEEERREGTGSEPVFQGIAKQLDAAGVEYETPFAVGALPEAGLSDREIVKRTELLEYQLPIVTAALARGDSTVLREELDELLHAFQCNLDRKSAAYRKLGMAVLAAHVRGLKDIERRNAGDPVETPQSAYVLPGAPVAHEGGTLRDALEGWKNERERPENVTHEYARAVEMFIQLHGNLAIASIKRSHALAFREALRLVPKIRNGDLRKAGLPELSQWGREHPQAPKVSVATVNKQLGAAQAIANWGYDKGFVPDDVPWPDPFRNMRLEEEQSERGSFNVPELQAIFNAPIFTGGDVPVGAQGAAGFWLPVVALFTGARQAEIAGLQVSNVQELEGVPLLYIAANRRVGKRVKTKASERVVPIHPELLRLGLLDYVTARTLDGAEAWLFPSVAPDQRRALAAWSKWFGQYLRKPIGVTSPDRVFHSFRHSFQDALRRATPDAELRDALPGRSSRSKSVSRDYGAKYMIDRWGVETLRKTIEGISYPGLDLSRVRPPGSAQRARGTKVA
jgi:integrase